MSGPEVTLAGDFGKPAVTLIEKVSDAIGGLAKPWQIQRVAKAEAKAEVMRAEARLEISDLERRALQRMVREEGKKQVSIENITLKAANLLSNSATPEDIEADWITRFFERARLVSDDRMQTLWAAILAGQSENPGSFSLKAIDVLATLERRDALDFATLKRFAVTTNAGPFPAIYSLKEDIYNKHDVNWYKMKHLEDLGLVHLSSFSEQIIEDVPEKSIIGYYGVSIGLTFKTSRRILQAGWISLSKAGLDIFNVCENIFDQEFLDYLMAYWEDKGLSPVFLSEEDIAGPGNT